LFTPCLHGWSIFKLRVIIFSALANRKIQDNSTFSISSLPIASGHVATGLLGKWKVEGTKGNGVQEWIVLLFLEAYPLLQIVFPTVLNEKQISYDRGAYPC